MAAISTALTATTSTASTDSKNFSTTASLAPSPDEISLVVNRFSVSFWSIDYSTDTMPRPITCHKVSSIVRSTIDLTKMFSSKVPEAYQVPCTELVVRAPFKAGNCIGISKTNLIKKSNEMPFFCRGITNNEEMRPYLCSGSELAGFEFPKDQIEVVKDFVFFTCKRGKETMKDGHKHIEILGIEKIERLVCKFVSTAGITG